ncbi:hypothetical protein Emed_006686 [Eimeria media]
MTCVVAVPGKTRVGEFHFLLLQPICLLFSAYGADLCVQHFEHTFRGWIGVGVMGKAMCANILKKGFEMIIYRQEA